LCVVSRLHFGVSLCDRGRVVCPGYPKTPPPHPPPRPAPAPPGPRGPPPGPAEKGAELEVVLGDRVSHVFATPDRLATLILALLRLALNGADPGLLRLRAEDAGAETVRLYVEADGAEAETERKDKDPPGDPLEGERMERAILGLLVEGLGGRVDWACPETNGRGPAVYLQAAGENR
jgi:hypothetical protein